MRCTAKLECTDVARPRISNSTGGALFATCKFGAALAIATRASARARRRHCAQKSRTVHQNARNQPLLLQACKRCSKNARRRRAQPLCVGKIAAPLPEASLRATMERQWPTVLAAVAGVAIAALGIYKSKRKRSVPRATRRSGSSSCGTATARTTQIRRGGHASGPRALPARPSFINARAPAGAAARRRRGRDAR